MAFSVEFYPTSMSAPGYWKLQSTVKILWKDTQKIGIMTYNSTKYYGNICTSLNLNKEQQQKTFIKNNFGNSNWPEAGNV